MGSGCYLRPDQFLDHLTVIKKTNKGDKCINYGIVDDGLFGKFEEVRKSLSSPPALQIDHATPLEHHHHHDDEQQH